MNISIRLVAVFILDLASLNARAQSPVPHLLRMERSPSYEKFDDRLEDYLISKVPEIRLLAQYVYCWSRSPEACVSSTSPDSCTHKGLIEVERTSNPSAATKYRRDYYWVFVGESGPEMDHRWCTFLIHKQSRAILYYDIGMDTHCTLAQLRKRKSWCDEWNHIRAWLSKFNCD